MMEGIAWQGENTCQWMFVNITTKTSPTYGGDDEDVGGHEE
jgi:hypothetical protein